MRLRRLLYTSTFLIGLSGLAAGVQAQAPETRQQGQLSTLQLPAGEGAVDAAHGSVQFIGTATVLIRYQGFTILTDPNFLHKGDHVHLGYGLTSERKTNPAIAFDDLPAIDLVVLSHFHGDHFDQLVQKRLTGRCRSSAPARPRPVWKSWVLPASRDWIPGTSWR